MLAKEQVGCFHPVFPNEGLGQPMAGQQLSIAEIVGFG